MLDFTSAESTVEMLLNSASGLRWTSSTPTRHAVPNHNFSLFFPHLSTRFSERDAPDVTLPPGQSYHSPEGRLKLVIQPRSQRLNVGESLQLECGAVGRPIPRYQWHRNGVPLPNATKRKLVVRRWLFLFFEEMRSVKDPYSSRQP